MRPPMELTKLIAELRAERASIEQAITVLERLARSQGKRRGRPPAWLSLSGGLAPRKRNLSPEARRRMADAQKRRWAAFRKAKKAAE